MPTVICLNETPMPVQDIISEKVFNVKSVTSLRAINFPFAISSGEGINVDFLKNPRNAIKHADQKARSIGLSRIDLCNASNICIVIGCFCLAG